MSVRIVIYPNSGSMNDPSGKSVKVITPRQ